LDSMVDSAVLDSASKTDVSAKSPPIFGLGVDVDFDDLRFDGVDGRDVL